MLVAELRRIEISLESIEDAETLLGILSRAKPVRSDYRLPESEKYYEDPFAGEFLEIKVTSSKIINKEQADKHIAAYESDRVNTAKTGKE